MEGGEIIAERQKEEFDLNFKEGHLDICFQHDAIVTQEDADFRRWVTQQRLSQRIGKPIPLDKIEISPDAGEQTVASYCFRVEDEEMPIKRGRYIGLEILHSRNPQILPRVQIGLEQYGKTHSLEVAQVSLVQRAVAFLREIIEPKLRS